MMQGYERKAEHHRDSQQPEWPLFSKGGCSWKSVEEPKLAQVTIFVQQVAVVQDIGVDKQDWRTTWSGPCPWEDQVWGNSLKVLNGSDTLFLLQSIFLCNNLKKDSDILMATSWCQYMARARSQLPQLHLRNWEIFVFHYRQRSTFINDMKRIYKTVFKSKKPSLGPIHGTSTSTSTGTSDLMPSIPACDSESDGTASAQLTAGVTVSAQPRPSQL